MLIFSYCLYHQVKYENILNKPFFLFSEMDSRGFHGDTFDEGFKRFSPYKRNDPSQQTQIGQISPRNKRDTYDPGYESYMYSVGYDPTMAFKKRKRNGYYESIGYDPTFWAKRDDFGDYYYPQHFLGTGFKRSDSTYNDVIMPFDQFHYYKRFSDPYDYYMSNTGIYKRSVNNKDFEEDSSNDERKKREATPQAAEKRRPEMDASGFHGDMFSNGFGDFYTLKKRKLGMGASGFHGDMFNEGFGDFSTMKKRRPEMDSSGFYGDTFSGGFGDFYTMKRNNAKRRPEMDSSGFYGDTFSGGFGDFYTMKRNPLKRRPEMDSSGFYGDTFSGGFGDFYTMKKKNPKPSSLTKERSDRKKREVNFQSDTVKRRPEMDSSGFYGDTFSGGFGDFYTMKRNQKRRPEMDSSGFYGDTFSGGFGDFYTMKKRLNEKQIKMLRAMEGRPKRSIHDEDDFSHEVSTEDDSEESEEHDRERREIPSNSLRSSESDYTNLANQRPIKTLQKRYIGIDSRGFHDNLFSDGFGDFSTMKKR